MKRKIPTMMEVFMQEANVTTLAQMNKIPLEVAEIINNFDRKNAPTLAKIFAPRYIPASSGSPETLKQYAERSFDKSQPNGIFNILSNFLNKNPTKASEIINSATKDWREFSGKMKDFQSSDGVEEKMKGAEIKFPDGSFWKKLSRKDSDDVAHEMQHCGTPTYHSSELFQLYDSQGRGHATIELNGRSGAAEDDGETSSSWNNEPVVIQIKGKQNAFPQQKYWPAIKSFLKHFNASNQETLTPHEFRNP